MLKTAVLLHFSDAIYLNDFKDALSRLPPDLDLYINLVSGLHSDSALDEQQESLQEAFPQAKFIRSENRGMEIGGMFSLFDHIKDHSYGAVLYVHASANHDWYKQVLLSLSMNVGKILLKFTEINDEITRPAGMIGVHVRPFDYYNIGPFMGLAAKFGVKLRTSWEEYFERVPTAQDMEVIERARWATKNDLSRHRPEVDLEYARAVFGNLNEAKQKMDQQHLTQFSQDRVIGPLPYFPGSSFWIHGDLLDMLAQKIDFQSEFDRLPEGITSDQSEQSLVHAWERFLPVFAEKLGYRILSLE